MNARSGIPSRLSVLARDIAGLGAIVAIAYGAWMIYVPAGFITGGILLLAMVILSAAGDR